MATIVEEMTRLAKAGKNVAGYIEKGPKSNVFRYYISDNENIPAVAYILDSGEQSNKTIIYTDLPEKHWVLTYTGRTVKRVADLKNADITKAGEIHAKAALTGLKLKVLAGDRGFASPIPGGGLYDAAIRLKGGKGAPSTGRNKALERALRYYMLAGYSLLGLCAEAGYEGGNYIAAMMVSDEGKILSFGVNSGWFHHGEVNMLLNYFSKDANKTNKKFEENTIIFSTLTPCKQCTDYLLACRPVKSHIYIGQEDTGEFGKAGADHFEFIDKVTKAPNLLPIQGDALLGRAVHSHLSAKMGGEGSVASKIGKNCKTVLLGAANSMVHKTMKDRDNSSEEQAIKGIVLSYLAGWLGTVSLSVS